MELSNLEKEIGYKFNNIDLLQTALTHVSFANQFGTESYERLEFLGDAVIEVVVSDFIYNSLDFDAGVSTKLRASLVSTEYLSLVASRLSLSDYLQRSKSLQTVSKKNTADIVESIVGAVYVDGGIDKAKEFIDKFIIISPDNVSSVLKSSVDYKSKFQELMQAEGKSFEYRVLSSTGLDHSKTFTVGLFVEGNLVSSSTGSSIHIAEEQCAKSYFD